MKVLSVGLLLCAEATAAVVADGHFQYEKRQIGGALTALLKGDNSILGTLGNGPYGRVAVPAGAKPSRQTLTPEPAMAKAGSNVKRVKVRYGPYLVPSMHHENKYTHHLGMLESYYDAHIEKPCAGPCNLLKQVAGMEYADGSNANIDTGLWLHHMIHFNTGPGRWDPVAYNVASCLPHEGVNMAPPKAKGQFQVPPKPFGTTNAKNTERYFVSGNERTPFNFWNGNPTAGTAYHLKATDKFYFLVELMNMNMKNGTVWVTMDYHYTEGALPAGWKSIKTVFLDANSCMSSEVVSPAGKMQFQVPSIPWKPNVEGPIVDSIGHVHDGGTNIDIKASSTPLCNSVAEYSTKKEFKYDVSLNAKMNQMMNLPKSKEEFVAADHISNMAGCGPKDIQVKSMSKNQMWTTTGYYDYNKRVPNKAHGKFSDVMAISIVLVAAPLDVRPV